jgi:hypothetical protein
LHPRSAELQGIAQQVAEHRGDECRVTPDVGEGVAHDGCARFLDTGHARNDHVAQDVERINPAEVMLLAEQAEL